MKTTQSSANPFPGLRPFQFHENHLFFGREGQSEELLRKLRRNRFLAVVGTSGSGKSSLVRAGLLPLLYGGFMTQAGPQWRIALFRPGKDPIHNMAVALNSPTPFEPGYMEGQEDLAAEMSAGQAAPDEKLDADLKLVKIAALETTLRRSAVGLVDYVRRARMREGENLLVVVDQFEELFRFKEKAEGKNSQDEAAAFVKLLLEAVEDESAPIYVVLTMRSDFLGDCSQFRDLPEKINESQYLIPRMTRDQRRDAITSPAAVRGAKMTQRLLNRLLNDVGDNPDQLPILQHALMRTWDFWAQENRDGGARGEIDLQHYEAIGGMEEALSKHADEAYNGLPDVRSKQIAEKMFKALTETVTDSREVRRPSVLSEICAVAEATEEEVKPVIEVFRHPSKSFLMPPPGVTLEANTLIDISHESLIRNWALMKEWVKEEAQSARIYRRVAEAGALHREGKEGLLTDPGLQFALEWREKVKPNKAWAKRYHPEFDATLEFLKKSEERRDDLIAAEGRRKQDEAERDKRELAAAQALAEAEQRRAADQTRAARKFRLLAAALAVMLLVAAVTAVMAYRLKGAAESQKSVAEFQKAAAESQRAIAEKEAMRAQEAEAQAKESLTKLDTALQGKENARKSAEEANLKAQAQAKAAKAAERQAQLAQAAEKRKKDELVEANKKNEMNREGLEAFEKGDLSTALSRLRTLRDLSHGNQKEQAWVEYTLGAVLKESGDYEEAAKSYTNALTTQQLLYGEKSHETASTLNKLARVYREQGDFEKAGEKYEKALEIKTYYASQNKLYSPSDLYELKSEIADFYMEQSRDAEAGVADAQNDYNKLITKAGESKAGGPAEDDVRKSLEKMESLRELAQKRYEEAGKLYEEVALFREQEYLFDKFLPSRPELAASYDNLAQFYQSDGSFKDEDKAKGYYELARAIRESKLTPGHMNDERALEGLRNVAEAYKSVNRILPAALMYDKFLTGAEAALGDAGALVISLYLDVAQFYRAQKLYARAETLYLKILASIEKDVDSDVLIDFQETIGMLYWEAGKYAEAESYLKKARAGREKTLKPTEKPDNWIFGLNGRTLARLYSKQPNRLAEAEAGFKRALTDMDTMFGAASAEAIGAAYDLGHFYFEQQRDGEAEPLLKRVQQFYLSKIGPDKRPSPGYTPESKNAVTESLTTVLKNEYGSFNTPDIYIKTLSDLAAIKVRQADKQSAESPEAKALYNEAETLYKEMLSALTWLESVVPESGFISPFEMSTFNARDEKNVKKAQMLLYAKSLESYVAFLKKMKKTTETLTYEIEAKNKRAQVGTYEDPPWKP